ncbi:MAG: SufE family protein [Caldilineaceae bacterium]|nr:SufE family protein [Caldilineaceae bacterium]MCB9137502.1 SufE family protein [Caldilineaceae bacterium]
MTDRELEAKLAACRPALREVIEEFRLADPRERLEYLVDFSLELPDLPPRLAGRMDEMEQVHECQSPVFLHTEMEDGRVRFYFGIPAEAPTVRGYAGALLEGLDGATPEEVLTTPDTVYALMGLNEALTPQRTRGLHALMGYMKRQVIALQA